MQENERPRNESAAPAPLLTEAEFRHLLGGISERHFKKLKSTGIVPAPLQLGPRIARWTPQDYTAVLERLTRREVGQEPPSLAVARRARIERMKGAPA